MELNASNGSNGSNSSASEVPRPRFGLARPAESHDAHVQVRATHGRAHGRGLEEYGESHQGGNGLLDLALA